MTPSGADRLTELRRNGKTLAGGVAIYLDVDMRPGEAPAWWHRTTVVQRALDEARARKLPLEQGRALVTQALEAMTAEQRAAADREWWEQVPDIAISPEQPIGRLDLRCVVGLSVAVRVPEKVADERIDALVERLIVFGADRVSVCRAWLGDDDDRLLTIEVVEGKRV